MMSLSARSLGKWVRYVQSGDVHHTVVRHLNKIAVNPVQAASLGEMCILVNERDECVGSASKRDCHLVDMNAHLPLHRAFSVFIFNSRQELLLQKRSSTKITFPGHVTNSCCSHPLHELKEERQEEDALGIKLAARRRLNYELGIPQDMLTPNDMIYLTRIIYKDIGNGVWGEHEVDYILFIINKDFPLKPNPEEVDQVLFVPRHGFEQYIQSLTDPVTPWFSLVTKYKLLTWWDNLYNLKSFQDHVNIENFKTT